MGKISSNSGQSKYGNKIYINKDIEYICSEVDLTGTKIAILVKPCSLQEFTYELHQELSP